MKNVHCFRDNKTNNCIFVLIKLIEKEKFNSEKKKRTIQIKLIIHFTGECKQVRVIQN